VQGGNALGGGADVEHSRPSGLLDPPGSPRAALSLDGDESVQFVLGIRVETDAQAVGGLGAFGHRPRDELLPALALGREVGRGEGAGDGGGLSHGGAS